MTGFAKDGDEFVMQQNSIRKGLGLTKPYAPDGKPVVREFAQLREAAIIAGIDPAVPGSDRTVIDCPPEMAELILFAMLAPATAMLLRLVIAHDGSLGAALSKAIVARAEQIGVAGLADISAPSLSSSTLDSRLVADGDPK